MSDAIWVAIILALALLGMTAMVCYTWRKIETDERSWEQPEDQPPASVVPILNEMKRRRSQLPQYKYPKTEVHQPAPQNEMEEVPQDAPWPVDKENLPRKVVYNPRPGSTYTPPTCECHKRPIKSGQTVMFWPLPDNGGTKVFCLKEDL